MFNFSGYAIEEYFDRDVKARVSKEGSTIDILRVLEFESALQRMSVIVRAEGAYYVFTKGSPEKVSELSYSLPHNLKPSLELLTMKGLRVLGIGIRSLTQEEAIQLSSDKCSRDQVECDI